jgi:hypothetical protein
MNDAVARIKEIEDLIRLFSIDVPASRCGGVTTGRPHDQGTCHGCDVWNWGNPNDLLRYCGITHHCKPT